MPPSAAGLEGDGIAQAHATASSGLVGNLEAAQPEAKIDLQRGGSSAGAEVAQICNQPAAVLPFVPDSGIAKGPSGVENPAGSAANLNVQVPEPNSSPDSESRSTNGREEVSSSLPPPSRES